MATIAGTWQVSGLTPATPGQSPGQLSAVSSTSGSINTASAGVYLIEEQSLGINYHRIPIFNFAFDNTYTLSGYTFATVPTPAVHNTQIQYMAQANYSRSRVYGGFAGSFTRTQKFTLHSTSAADGGGMYTNQTVSGILGAAGEIATSASWYNRRPWVDTDTEVAHGVIQHNFYGRSIDCEKTQQQQDHISSSLQETAFLHGSYLAPNLPEAGIPGFPTSLTIKAIMPLNTLMFWGIYNPGQESQHMVTEFIDYVGHHVKVGHDAVPSMRDANDGTNTISNYETWRHDYT